MPVDKLLNRDFSRLARRQLSGAARLGAGSVKSYFDHWAWHHHQDHDKEWKDSRLVMRVTAPLGDRLTNPRLYRAGKLRR